jgi:nitric oxide reductase large subunit
MFDWTILSLFLYFPEDKTEYIPAAITSVIFLIAAILTMRFIMKKSKQEEEKTKALEEKMLQYSQEDKKE